MRTGPPPSDNRQRRSGHPGAAAASWSTADSLDARRAWLGAFWALMLCRFRDYANQGRHPGAGPERQAEEDR
jgi:hypothetical protein